MCHWSCYDVLQFRYHDKDEEVFCVIILGHSVNAVVPGN